jgi:hypothetical protein
MIRIGTIKYVDGKKVYPSYPNFKRIEVMTPSTAYGPLSPYSLKDENGCIMENIWQFSKVYSKVPACIQRYSRYNQMIIWNHPTEIHINDNGALTLRYFMWRAKGMFNKYAVRYPVGYNKAVRSSCKFSYNTDPNNKLNYIQARKRIYLPLYNKLVQNHSLFKHLKMLLTSGKNLLIVEVDGPREESIEYYKEKYGVESNFIENDTILLNEDNMRIMINDTRHAFGHGYCLAMALKNMVHGED